MSLIGLLILCVVVGAGLYLLNMVPIDPAIKTVIRVVVILVLVIYVIVFIATMFGVNTNFPPMRVR